jgi:predicted nucleic acid-binding protein
LRFWDTSALAALLVDEPRSKALKALLSEDLEIAVWWASRVECVSAIRRREREGALDKPSVERALDLLAQVGKSWFEILPGDAVRALAERALAVHPLRAADALQLAAALTWQPTPVRQAEFVCLDEQLRDAASREGFLSVPVDL